jgi:biotin synthase
MTALRPQVAIASYRALLRESRSHFLRNYGTVSAVSTPRSAFESALEASAPRTNWTKEEIKEIYDTPLMKLAYAAVCVNCSHASANLLTARYQGTVHRKFHNPASIQMCTLMNIKTGGCSEDCSYVRISKP